MKKMKDWVRQEDLDAKLDGFVKEAGQLPAGMTPNEVAEKLGITANGNFYRQFRDWKHRREAEAAMPPLEIPDEVRTELVNVLSEASDLVMDQFARVVRSIAGDIDRSAALRVRDAERRAAEAEAETEHVLERWTETEKELEATRHKAAEARKDSEEMRRVADRLLGQLDERGRLLAGLEDRVRQQSGSDKDAAHQATPVPPEAEELRNAKASPEDATNEDKMTGTEPVVVGPAGPTQSSINEDDGKDVHQTELSLGNTDDAVQAEAGDDEND
ncbi:hypothetical protein A3736_15290 [Erythrobacter sp. HI0063]|uniref:hypothetical protein n=1 Tax=Erythrobacter sp. HI0063 TaxID=1822240 RepID=UPI0007C20D9E|nr:hypothetical protein [Erythrobacter sp. HI0063]KZY58149.1 hypothetical protein A3736_15290 [Erythrobacter sp. HI0063]